MLVGSLGGCLALASGGDVKPVVLATSRSAGRGDNRLLGARMAALLSARAMATAINIIWKVRGGGIVMISTLEVGGWLMV